MKADYKGIDNRDLKQLNLQDWQIPAPGRNDRIRQIMEIAIGMEPGEMVMAYRGRRDEAKLLQSALWRLIKRHEVGVQVEIRGVEIHLSRPDE